MSTNAPTHQVPKSTHPWRKYKIVIGTKVTTVIKNVVNKEPKSNIIPVKEFIRDLADNWDRSEVVLPYEFEGSHHAKLSLLPQAKAASHIAGQLKRYYGCGEF